MQLQLAAAAHHDVDPRPAKVTTLAYLDTSLTGIVR